MQVPIFGSLGAKNGVPSLCDGVYTGGVAELGLGFAPWTGVLDVMLFDQSVAF